MREQTRPVSAIDHDRLFKELIVTFFVEFLELFFPEVAREIDHNSVAFLNQEQFFKGEKSLADIVAKVRHREGEVFFIIHVENQSSIQPYFPQRMFEYWVALQHKHKLPIYPIVVYSHSRPKKRQPNTYAVRLLGLEVHRFRFRVIQLNRLRWRKFANSHNPVASALMAKMAIAEKDRLKVKLECLRLMVTLKLDRDKMKLIVGFVDTYLSLNESEELLLEKKLRQSDLTPSEQETVMEIVTSWERRGIEKGRQEGLQEGRQEGHEEGRQEGLEKLRSLLSRSLESRFPPLSPGLKRKIAAIDSMDRLEDLTLRAWNVKSIRELGI